MAGSDREEGGGSCKNKGHDDQPSTCKHVAKNVPGGLSGPGRRFFSRVLFFQRIKHNRRKFK